ncbi:Aste57867_11473 [Aphanomyces stellatus]|uniref:Aste57867_11473 protein n=1 Tax=Aphanomyces stellatus TaxID=120398 RepID=A0A485KUY8_9STRA|nr:hypothetical protein As57867_011430 [Aphanomyces stellatus]VFT88334.1 Aste57867_11473 [Aphanomyces stellatus]
MRALMMRVVATCAFVASMPALLITTTTIPYASTPPLLTPTSSLLPHTTAASFHHSVPSPPPSSAAAKRTPVTTTHSNATPIRPSTPPRPATDTESSPAMRLAMTGILTITLVLMALLQLVALIGGTTSSSFSSNVWELLLYLSFLQHLSLLSLVRSAGHLPLFFITTVDTLSWIQGFWHGRHALRPSSTEAVTSCRAIYANTEGFAAFSSRVHVDEANWFATILWTWVESVGGCLLLATAAFASYVYVWKHHHATTSHPSALLALCLGRAFASFALVFFLASLLPLSVVSLHEIRQYVNCWHHESTDDQSGLACVVLLLLFVCLVWPVHALVRQTPFDRPQVDTPTAIFCIVLAAPYHYHRRLAFLFPLSIHFISAIVVGSALPMTGPHQCLALASLHTLALVAVVVLRPFVCKVHFAFVLASETFLASFFGLAMLLLRSESHSSTMQMQVAFGILCGLAVVVTMMALRQVARVFVVCICPLPRPINKDTTTHHAPFLQSQQN